VSQVLTLFTTPVIYLYMDGLNTWVSKFGFARPPGDSAPAGDDEPAGEPARS
jgi:HAE1 family hydrophobic/amphiphilic exporter-1